MFWQQSKRLWHWASLFPCPIPFLYMGSRHRRNSLGNVKSIDSHVLVPSKSIPPDLFLSVLDYSLLTAVCCMAVWPGHRSSILTLGGGLLSMSTQFYGKQPFYLPRR